MSDFGLKATVREGRGKGVARRLRAQGQIPAVVYGAGEPVAVALAAKEVDKILNAHGGSHAVIDLDLDGKKKQVLIRDYQSHWSNGHLLHCDLLELHKDHKVTVTVGLEIVGEVALGVRESQGIMQQQMHEIEIDCLPSAMPESIQVDASALDIGDSLHVSDLTLPEGVQVHATGETAICTVLAPKLKTEESTEESGEEATEEVTEDDSEE